MEKSPHEPANATATATVSPGSGQQRQQGIQNGDQHPTPRRTLARRAASSSLLSRLLSPTYEAEEPIAVNATAGDRSQLAPRTPEISLNSTLRDEANDRNAEPGDIRPAKTMAQTIMPRYMPSQSLEAHHISTSTKFHLHDLDINHVNSVLMDHRDFLQSSRLRGTSLERTPKEKMVQHLPEAAVSNYAGDTGFALPTTPIDLDSGNISEHPPTEGYRAEYRSWRDGQKVPGMGKAWSIGDEVFNQESDGQVEKSITQALAGNEHDGRSRKSSHSVRLFKKGLPDDKPKKREGKDGNRLKDKSIEASSEGGLGGHSAISAPGAESFFELPVTDASGVAMPSPQKNAHTSGRPSRSNTSRRHVATSEESQSRSERPNSLPAQLLDDLRKRHNLTPAAAKGSSFSKSIPLTDSERITQEDLEDDTCEETVEIPSVEGRSVTEPHLSDEDDSSEEKISSALFVPHQSSREPREPLDHTSPRKEPFSSGVSERRDSVTESEQWLVEHEVAPRDAENKAPGDLPPAKTSPEICGLRSRPPSGYFSPAPGTADWTYGPVSEGGYSTKGEESSQNEDFEITPTDKKARDYMAKNHEQLQIAQPTAQPTAKAPLEAIELIPYKHQVGGHTTLWRFSKRAVCKQLNNRENEFYETVEHYHPALLKFMPRYIGVLNVTFEKQLKRKPTIKDEGEVPLESNVPASARAAQLGAARVTAGAQSDVASTMSVPNRNEPPPRVISQSLSTQVTPPTVTFADNRHIIPKSFLERPLLNFESRYKSLSDTGAQDSPSHKSSRSASAIVNGERPTLSDRHAVSWGATTVNRKLRYEVFGEAFLRQPIPIQPHKKPGQHHRNLPHRTTTPTLRSTNSDSSLGNARDLDYQVARPETSDGSLRMQAIRGSAERHGLAFESPTKNETHIAIPSVDQSINGDGSEAGFQDQAGTSAPEVDTLVEAPKGKKKRRYSSGGLRRKPQEVAEDRGSLKYFVEADDAGYTGDGEDDVFTMDPEVPVANTVVTEVLALEKPVSEPTIVPDAPKLTTSQSQPEPAGERLPAATDAPTPPPLPPLNRPVNPKEAQTQTQRDSRVEYFLLLEDLTAGMRRPCIMDLKMGTRQYGVEANAKKQKSQRRKCADTTSKQLGVRVCGLQVWDVATQAYIFQDKYFGRDLKVGHEFQGALMRFLYDGVDYASILRHIPTIIHKLAQLEVLIKHLNGYRFYAASLLMFYDGAVDDDTGATTDTSIVTEKRKVRDIDFKIADFANCVTAENGSVMSKPCPPQHPDTPDRGFLRGLRSLRRYFLYIQKDIMEKEKIRRDIENEEENEATPFASDYSEGEVSF